MRLCLRNFPHCFPGSELSNPCFLKAPEALQSSMTIDWTTDETQLTSESTSSFPMFQSNDTIWVTWVGKETKTWKGPYMWFSPLLWQWKWLAFCHERITCRSRKQELQMLPNGVSLDNEPIKIKVSSGPKILPLHCPQTPPESDIWNE